MTDTTPPVYLRLRGKREEAELRARLAWDTAEILAARFAKDPGKAQAVLHTKPTLPHPGDQEPARLERSRDCRRVPPLHEHDPACKPP